MVKYLSILFLLISSASYSQVKVSAPLVRNSSLDTAYGTHYDTLGYGGHMSYETITNRNTLFYGPQRKIGTFVYVHATDTVYALSGGTSNSNWLPLFKLSNGLSGSFFLQGGNSFGASAILGTKDANPLRFITNNTPWLNLDVDGNLFSLNGGFALNTDGSTYFANATVNIDNLGNTSVNTLAIDNITSTTDTINFKPVAIDVNGNTRKLTSWPGGGGNGFVKNDTINGQSGGFKFTSGSKFYGDSLRLANQINNLLGVPIGGDIYFYGNSETAGYGLPVPSVRFSTRTASKLNLIEHNLGISGSTMQVTPGFGAGALDLSTIVTRPSTGRYIFFAFSNNDLRYLAPGYDTTTFKVAYQKAIDTAAARGWNKTTQMKIITPVYFGNNVFIQDSITYGWAHAGNQQTIQNFVTALKTLGATNGIQVIDIYTPMVAANGNSLLQYDSLHLNSAGGDLVSDVIVNAIYTPWIRYQRLVSTGITEFDKLKLNRLLPITATGNYTVLGLNDSSQVVSLPNQVIQNQITLPTTNPINTAPQFGNINISGKYIGAGANYLGVSENIITTGGIKADSINARVIGTKTGDASLVQFTQAGVLHFIMSGGASPFVGFNRSSQSGGIDGFAVGQNASANGAEALALGAFSSASGNNSFAGAGGVATNSFATAFQTSRATGQYSFAACQSDTASGSQSATFGGQTQGASSFSANSILNYAKGTFSTTHGQGSRALPQSSFVMGQFNDTTGQTVSSTGLNDWIFNIGNGSSNTSRSSSFTVQRNGWTSIGASIAKQALHVHGQVQIDTMPNGTFLTDSFAVIHNNVISKIAPSTLDTRYAVYSAKGSAALSFGSTNGGASSDLTITATGASVGDQPILGIPIASINANSMYTAWVSATNTVTVRFLNIGSTPITPTSGTFTVTVIKQ
jgi:hypothetical protein